MTYKELKEHIQRLNKVYNKNLKISEGNLSIRIYDEICFYYVSIPISIQYCLDIRQGKFVILDADLRYNLLKVVYEFVKTPPNQRGSYSRYQLASSLIADEQHKYLCKFNEEIDCLSWSDENDESTQFSPEEVDYVKDKFKTNLEDFIITEVRE